MKTVQERFDEKYVIEQETGCWLWIGSRYRKGYGQLRIGKSMRAAHRVSWQLRHGEIPEGMFACHKCDVRNCVNPDHLFLGDHASNVADMMAKGRQAKGEASGPSKLNPDKVRAIRASAETQCAIAAKYGVCQALVSKIKRRDLWKHVEDQ